MQNIWVGTVLHGNSVAQLCIESPVTLLLADAIAGPVLLA